MTKKLVLAIALTALTITACGGKDSYKAARLNKSSQPSPEELNQRATRNIEVTALKLINNDELYASSKNNALSETLKNETLGLSAKVTVGDKVIVEVTKLDDKAVDCKETSAKVEIEKTSIKSLNRINNFGRVACVDDNCESIVLLMETRRNVKTEENSNGTIIDGSVAVLLKKEASDLHKPLTTEAPDFLQINETEVAVTTCIELALAEEKALLMENVQEEIGKHPSSDDAIRNQKKNSAQNERLKAIEARIQAIDARQKELLKSSTMTDEPKALATERSQLIKERDSILSPRNLPKVDTVEAQPEAVNPA